MITWNFKFSGFFDIKAKRLIILSFPYLLNVDILIIFLVVLSVNLLSEREGFNPINTNSFW